MKDFYRPHILLILGGFSSSSSSPTASTDTTATASGKAATSSPDAVQTGDSSIAVGSGGKYQEAGAVDLSGVTNSAGGTISFNDPAALSDLAKTFADTTANIASSAAQTSLASNNTFLQGLQQLALSQQTGGLTPVMKTFLWLALGGIGLLAFIFRKKS